MKYYIALSPDLDMTPDAFVTTWNKDSEAHSVTEARLEKASSAYFDPSAIGGAIAVFSTLGYGVAAHALYDLVKHVVMDHTQHKHIKIVESEGSDGNRLLVVTIDEN